MTELYLIYFIKEYIINISRLFYSHIKLKEYS